VREGRERRARYSPIVDQLYPPIGRRSGSHLLEYFGATIEEMRQWGTNGLIHAEDLPREIERFTQSIESGAPYDSEHRLRRSDGVYRWFQSRGFPLRDANGDIVRWCWLLTDIDDRKHAEDAARKRTQSQTDHRHDSGAGVVGAYRWFR